MKRFALFPKYSLIVAELSDFSHPRFWLRIYSGADGSKQSPRSAKDSEPASSLWPGEEAAMKTRLKISLCAVLILFGIGVIAEFLQWMNRPSDVWFVTGALGMLAMFVVIPTLIQSIWRSRP